MAQSKWYGEFATITAMDDSMNILSYIFVQAIIKTLRHENERATKHTNIQYTVYTNGQKHKMCVQATIVLYAIVFASVALARCCLSCVLPFACFLQNGKGQRTHENVNLIIMEFGDSQITTTAKTTTTTKTPNEIPEEQTDMKTNTNTRTHSYTHTQPKKPLVLNVNGRIPSNKDDGKQFKFNVLCLCARTKKHEYNM